jgi:small basic protein (TIGR04137 family)
LTSKAVLYILQLSEAKKDQQEKQQMSQHTSLKSVNKITAKRNVLKRFERIDIMRARGNWKEGDRALGLPKTKPQV